MKEQIVLKYEPNARQAEFHKSGEDYVVYGGARGGGKTCALVWEAFMWGIEHPGANMFIFRETYTALEQNVIREWKESIPKELYKYNESKHVAKLINNTTVSFSFVSNEDDARRYQGSNIDWIGIDELTKHSEKEVQLLLTCLRSAKGFRPKFRGTCNPGGVGHCVPYGEVLTPSGWKDIKELNIGDEVYSISPDKKVHIEKIKQKHHYKDHVYRINQRGIHLAMTGDHKFMKDNGELTTLAETVGRTTVRRTVEFEEGKPLEDFYFESKSTKQPEKISGKDFAELLGWYISEGSIVDRDHLVVICQEKEQHRAKIKALLDRCGIKYTEAKSAFNIYWYGLWKYFKDIGLHHCRNVFIPKYMLEATREEQEIFFEAAMAGDGHRQSETSGQYYTTSKQLADDFQELAIKLGYMTYLSSRQRENREGLSYCMSFKKQATGSTELFRSGKPKPSEELEDVYCIGLENYHAFIIRQHGSAWVSGNCWVKETYIIPTEYGKKVITDETYGIKIKFIPATVYDNDVLMKNDPAYVKRLENLPENEKQAFLYGNWDIFEGRFFGEWQETTHVVQPFEIPKEWKRYVSIDWGYKDFCDVLWHATDGLHIYTYRELHVKETSVRDVAHMIKSLMGYDEKIEYWVGSPDMWQTRGTGDTIHGENIADIFSQERIYFQKADNSRIVGWQVMREAMLNAEDGKPRWLIFNTCTNIIRCLPLAQYDDKNIEDMATEPHEITDALDSARYFLISRPSASKKKVEKDFRNYTPTEIEDYLGRKQVVVRKHDSVDRRRVWR